MPRSGATYSLPAGYLATTGETITATQHNSPLQDIATALTASVSRDGSGEMTGSLSINGGGLTTTGNIRVNSSSNAQITADANASGNQAMFAAQTNNVNRWQFGKNNVAESGSDTGSDFNIWRYNDAGVYQDSPISIARDTGNVTIANDLAVAGDLNVTGSVTGVSATTFATATQFRNDTAGSLALSPAVVWDAAEEVALTSSSNSVAWDMDSGINFKIDTLGENTTIANPTNAKPGQTGFLRIIQDATGSRTVAWGSNYDFAGGTAPTATTTANAQDMFFYCVITSSKVLITAVLNIS